MKGICKAELHGGAIKHHRLFCQWNLLNLLWPAVVRIVIDQELAISPSLKQCQLRGCEGIHGPGN